MATSPTPQPTPPEEGPERRMNLRRARTGGGTGSFSASSSTRAESLRGPDDLGDDDLNETIRANAPRLAAPSAPDEGDPHANRRMLAEAAMAGDSAYAREFRLSMLNKLLMRGISLDNIARELGVSISTVKNDRAELHRRLREAAKQLDINQLIGGQMAFYDEATALSLRITSQQGMPVPMKLAGIRTALAAKADQTRFLSSAGVFDVLSFRRAEDGQDLSDVQVLMQRTAEMMEQMMRDDAAPPADDAPKGNRVRRRARPGAFNKMSFDDPSASGSDGEVVDL